MFPNIQDIENQERAFVSTYTMMENTIKRKDAKIEELENTIIYLKRENKEKSLIIEGYLKKINEQKDIITKFENWTKYLK
jgi:hypothetical protein